MALNRHSLLKAVKLPAALAASVLCCPQADADLLKQSSFTSPKGGFIVVLTELRHSRYDKDEALEGPGRVSNVLWRVDFIPKGSNEPVATTNHADVYGWENGARPAATASLFRSIAWSPGEDFVLLPGEAHGPSAPGTPQMSALALNPSLPWKKAAVPLDNIHWMDSLALAGDYRRDCDYGVSWFDGSEGKMAAVKSSESPLGYELVSMKGSVATIRMVMDNCRLRDAPPRCLTHDIATAAEAPAQCSGPGR